MATTQSASDTASLRTPSLGDLADILSSADAAMYARNRERKAHA